MWPVGGGDRTSAAGDDFVAKQGVSPRQALLHGEGSAEPADLPTAGATELSAALLETSVERHLPSVGVGNSCRSLGMTGAFRDAPTSAAKPIKPEASHTKPGRTLLQVKTKNKKNEVEEREAAENLMMILGGGQGVRV